MKNLTATAMVNLFTSHHNICNREAVEQVNGLLPLLVRGDKSATKKRAKVKYANSQADLCILDNAGACNGMYDLYTILYSGADFSAMTEKEMNIFKAELETIDTTETPEEHWEKRRASWSK
jgi:hypothetical protein